MITLAGVALLTLNNNFMTGTSTDLSTRNTAITSSDSDGSCTTCLAVYRVDESHQLN